MPRRPYARKALRIGAPLAIIACTAVTIATLFWTVHFRPSAGLLISLKAGCIRLAWWNPRHITFDYARGLSAGPADARWRLRWLPYITRESLSTWVGLPLWIPAALALAGAAIARPRSRPGHCPRCQYDLRGLNPGSPCPECGRTATDTLGP